MYDHGIKNKNINYFLLVKGKSLNKFIDVVFSCKIVIRILLYKATRPNSTLGLYILKWSNEYKRHRILWICYQSDWLLFNI